MTATTKTELIDHAMFLAGEMQDHALAHAHLAAEFLTNETVELDDIDNAAENHLIAKNNLREFLEGIVR